MLEQGSLFSDTSVYILVAAGPQDERAVALVQAARKAGLRVTFAETVSVAARASEAAACVVLLRPDTWKAQTIATVMRAKPACLIPVLAEPMELPRGPWTHESISAGDEPELAEQEVIQALRSYLAQRPTPIPRRNTDPLTLNAILQPKKRRRRMNPRPFFTAMLILLIVGLGVALGYRYYTSQPGQRATASSTSTVPTTVPRVVYQAKTPGQNCDTGGGQWTQSNRYVKDKKTEIIDRYTTLQCQPDGSLLTRSGDYRFYSTIFFDGLSEAQPIAPHYLAQVNAAIVSGDARADVAMEVHSNSGYGRYRFDINTLGHWEANTTSTVDGTPLNRLAIGFFPKAAKTYTLAVEVNGPVMTFWIDNTKVTTVTDTTYTYNDSLSFAFADDTAHNPISALFSNFQYTELAPSTLSTPQALATATEQAQASAHTAYKARVPGYGCDQSAGQRQPLADEEISGKLHCTPGGMQLTAPANAQTITEEIFYWLNGHFPQNYKVSATIDMSATYNGCAGLGTRTNEHGSSYVFIICASGVWQIALLTDTLHLLAQGQVNAQNVYIITAKADSSSQSLYINGQLIKTVHDSHLKNTTRLSLLVGLYLSSRANTATFSNFIFTPLP